MAAPVAEAEAERITPIPDEDLIRRVIAGEEAAFEMLYERYFRRVFRFVQKRLHSRADTEETVQEVFINIFSSIASFRGEAPFAAWVLGLTRRTIAGRFKKKQHATLPLEGNEDPEQLDPLSPTLQRQATPLENYECRERLSRLEAAAQEHLTREQRTLFELHHLRHYSISEIAVSMKKTEDSVKASLYRTRKLLLAR
jgi:RNA polymerase sigma-70 factor (ECF subfamily)